MSEKQKRSEQDGSARLIRRLAQLKSAYTKKLDQTFRARELWEQCKWSPVLFNQFTRCQEESKNKYDLVIAAALIIIDLDCKARNQLTVRRLLFSKCKQEKSEAYGDYIIRLEAAHKEADVAIMRPGDIMCLQMLGGCQDVELLKKLLEVQPCQVEQLKQCAVTYESHKQTAGEKKGSCGHRVRKVETVERKNKYADVTCYKCYQKGHFSSDCEMSKSMLKCK